jgi:hypothetical protein
MFSWTIDGRNGEVLETWGWDGGWVQTGDIHTRKLSLLLLGFSSAEEEICIGSFVPFGWLARETQRFRRVRAPRSNTLRPVSSCHVLALGLSVVGLTNFSGEGVVPKSLECECSVRQLLWWLPSSPFYRCKGEGKRGKLDYATVLRSWRSSFTLPSARVRWRRAKLCWRLGLLLWQPA